MISQAIAPMQPNLSHLPSTAQKLVALVGLPATLLLVDRHGGQSMTLFSSSNSLQRIAETIGMDGAMALLKFYGNTPFTIPLCHSALRAVRNAAILAEFDRLTMVEKLSARESVARITRLFTPYMHLHERTIWRVLKTTGDIKPVDPRQMSLI